MGSFGVGMAGRPSGSPVCVTALELLKTAIAKAGYTDKVVIGMDVAASEFFRNGKYDLDFKSPDDPSRHITPDQLADLYKGFVKNYPGKQLITGKHSSSGEWGLIAEGGSWCAAPLTGGIGSSCLTQPLGVSHCSGKWVALVCSTLVPLIQTKPLCWHCPKAAVSLCSGVH